VGYFWTIFTNWLRMSEHLGDWNVFALLCAIFLCMHKNDLFLHPVQKLLLPLLSVALIPYRWIIFLQC